MPDDDVHHARGVGRHARRECRGIHHRHVRRPDAAHRHRRAGLEVLAPDRDDRAACRRPLRRVHAAHHDRRQGVQGHAVRGTNEQVLVTDSDAGSERRPDVPGNDPTAQLPPVASAFVEVHGAAREGPVVHTGREHRQPAAVEMDPVAELIAGTPVWRDEVCRLRPARPAAFEDEHRPASSLAGRVVAGRAHGQGRVLEGDGVAEDSAIRQR